jgi:hypothetical protein
MEQLLASKYQVIPSYLNIIKMEDGEIKKVNSLTKMASH